MVKVVKKKGVGRLAGSKLRTSGIRITKKMRDVVPTLKIAGEREIAADFAMKVYEKFDQMIKSVVLFGSSAKRVSTPESDIDIIVIIDDVSVRWDEELIAWYREELGKLIVANPYRKSLHISTVKLSTWWDDMMKGDPIVINVLRYGDALIDYGGFFNPLRILLKQGKIRSTPESIYTLLQRAPGHLTRARQSMLASVDGLYWTMTDAAHAALIAKGVQPASPEEIGHVLRKYFVEEKMLNKKFVGYYEEIHEVAKRIIHGEVVKINGKDLDKWFEMADDFLGEMARLVDGLIEKK
ncbi:nucleotidyltransferase domain-containing protein [Candidatus Pacearchaeota archaeon]|nr:nucleotidyltransferase domain-containing protein [Candidatus Pacearchaeota archaeon]